MLGGPVARASILALCSARTPLVARGKICTASAATTFLAGRFASPSHNNCFQKLRHYSSSDSNPVEPGASELASSALSSSGIVTDSASSTPLASPASSPSSSDANSDVKPTSFTSPESATQRPIDTISDIIWPPWQVTDLSKAQRKAFETHGADFQTHLSKEERRVVSRGVSIRRKLETEMKSKYGEDWYAILKEADVELRRLDGELHAKCAARREELDRLPPSDETEAAYGEVRRELRGWYVRARHDVRRKVWDEIAERRRSQPSATV